MPKKQFPPKGGVRVLLSVLSSKGRPFEERAVVSLRNKDQVYQLEKSSDNSFYEGNVPAGQYTVEASAKGWIAPSIQLDVKGSTCNSCVYMGKEGWPFYRMGKHAVPFPLAKGILAIAFPNQREKREKRSAQKISQLVEKLALEPYESITSKTKKGAASLEKRVAKADGAIWLFRLKGRDTKAARKKLSDQIKKILGEDARVGMPVDLEENQLKVMDNCFVVRFKQSVDDKTRQTLFEKTEVKVLRKFRQAENAWHIELPSVDCEENLNLIESWHQEGLLLYGEPEILAEITDDSFPEDAPDDPTFTSQANLTLQQVDDAWRILHDIDPNLQNGSPDVYVASLDRGIDIDHPDIGRDLTDGTPQLARCFDFSGMRECTVAGYTPDTNHGMGVYGIIAALTNNNTDMAGIAPNTHQIGLERPSLTSANYPDILLWAAGFTTGNDDPDWPAEPLPNGAAIISCSHGVNGLALSGIMDDTLQELANNGRGGLGTIVIYSAGNANTLITGFRTWAAHPNTLAIANSRQPNAAGVELKEGSSNFGPEIDVCAQGTGAPSLNHTGGEQNFGGTSAAAPTVAAVAALILSKEPGLSWRQVRDLLRNTAEIIDAENSDSVGQWIGGFSQWYGFGRINAAYAVCGEAPDVNLDNASIIFNDVPEGETTFRAAVFSVDSCLPVSLSIISGPGVDFSTPFGITVSLDLSSEGLGRKARLWIGYTATSAGDTTSGSIRVRWNETGEEWDIPISANTIARPTAAVMLVLDQSNSMSFDSGIGPGINRGDVLKFSAPPLVDVLQDDNAIGIIQFDHDPHDVLGIETAVPLGRFQANSHIASYAHNPDGWTSIGEAVARAHDILNPETGYDTKAMVVLTDGKENHGPHSRRYISDVSGMINEHVYAIGLGTPENLQPAALAALCNGHDGYLLMTGNLDADAYFRLAKYYQQILAGVENMDIVLDPEGYIKPGQEHRIPFRLTETDISCDVILLTPAPFAYRFILESPYGDRIDMGTAAANPAIEYKVGSDIAYYRFSLPAVINGVDLREGKWHAVLCLDDKYYRKYLGSLENQPELYEQTRRQGLRYSLNVRAYSNLRMRAQLSQNSFEPGADLFLKAILTEYGIPVENRAKVQAELTRPDGTQKVIHLTETEAGVFTAKNEATQAGVYHVLIKARGLTLRNHSFTREQNLTGFVWRGGDEKPPTSQDDPNRDKDCWCEFIRCLLQERAFGNYLEKLGIEVKVIRKCLEVYCKGCRPSGGENPNPKPQDFSGLLQDNNFQSFLERLYSDYLSQNS